MTHGEVLPLRQGMDCHDYHDDHYDHIEMMMMMIMIILKDKNDTWCSHSGKEWKALVFSAL